MQEEVEVRSFGEAGFTDSLAALAHPVRVEILQQLRSPKILKEVKAYTSEGEGAQARRRLLTRQAVKGHLDRLIQIGAVRVLEGDGSSTHYVLNQSALFCLAEEFRELAGLRPVEPSEDPTLVAPGVGGGVELHGPCLLLVKGLDEGRVFPLDTPVSGEEGKSWLLGRERGIEVVLDYDPFVSSHNTRIHWENGQWYVEDLPGSRNGTTCNMKRVPKGRRVPLKHRDLVGVGRSVLVFQSDGSR